MNDALRNRNVFVNISKYAKENYRSILNMIELFIVKLLDIDDYFITYLFHMQQESFVILEAC